MGITLLLQETSHFLAHLVALRLPVLVDVLTLNKRKVLDLGATLNFLLVVVRLGIFLLRYLRLVILRKLTLGPSAADIFRLVPLRSEAVLRKELLKELSRVLTSHCLPLMLLFDELLVLLQEATCCLRRTFCADPLRLWSPGGSLCQGTLHLLDGHLANGLPHTVLAPRSHSTEHGLPNGLEGGGGMLGHPRKQW